MRTLARLPRFFLGLVFVLMLAQYSRAAVAATTIDTRPYWTDGSTIAVLSNGNGTQTFGEVVTVPQGDTSLTSFSFFFNDRNVTPYLGPVNFGGYVMAWDGSKATGPILFDSGLVSSTNNHGTGLTNGQDRAADHELFEFSTGGISLSAGSQIVLFISTSNFYDGSLRQADLPWISTFRGPGIPDAPKAYPSGYAVYSNNGGDFSSLSNQNWGAARDADLAFVASFAAPVPEPNLYALLVAGLILVLVRSGNGKLSGKAFHWRG